MNEAERAILVEAIRKAIADKIRPLTTHPDSNRSMGSFLALNFVQGMDLERFKKAPE